MITTTVGDLLEALSKYKPDTPVIIADPTLNGYNRVELTRMMAYEVIVNQDANLPCDFVDAIHTDLPGSFCAIVL